MKPSSQPNFARAIKIGLLLGLVLVIATGVAIYMVTRQSAAAAAQAAQMEMEFRQSHPQYPLPH